MSELTTIYSLADPISNKVVYIGRTVSWPPANLLKIRNPEVKRYLHKLRLNHDVPPILNKLEEVRTELITSTVHKWVLHYAKEGSLFNPLSKEIKYKLYLERYNAQPGVEPHQYKRSRRS